MKLSILIPTLYTRVHYLNILLHIISAQDPQCLKETEVLMSSDGGIKSIGQKRNELLQAAKGEYLVFIDDDDEISMDYLECIFEGIMLGVDHIGIAMRYIPDNGPEKLVSCSKEHTKWGEEDGVYLRTVQHVCAIKTSIARQVSYPNTSFGEDEAYSKEITPLIQTEHLLTTPVYFYKFRSNKTV